MRAGLLREQVVIQRRADAPDAFGQPIPAWSDLATVWAAVEPERGREWFVGAQLQAVAPVRFRIRHRADLTTRDRVIWGGVVYDIRAVVDGFARQRELHLYCDTGISEG